MNREMNAVCDLILYFYIFYISLKINHVIFIALFLVNIKGHFEQAKAPDEQHLSQFGRVARVVRRTYFERRLPCRLNGHTLASKNVLIRQWHIGAFIKNLKNRLIHLIGTRMRLCIQAAHSGPPSFKKKDGGFLHTAT